MELETVPTLSAAELAVLRRALEREEVRLDGHERVYASAWRRAGLAEATGNADEPDRYALSPRSTRGATRA